MKFAGGGRTFIGRDLNFFGRKDSDFNFGKEGREKFADIHGCRTIHIYRESWGNAKCRCRFYEDEFGIHFGIVMLY